MGCNQSVPDHESDDDSDTDSSTTELPFEKVPFNNAVPSRSSITTISKPISNLNNINMKFENLHKINVTANGTVSPISNNDITPFPNTSASPPLKDDTSANSTATPIDCDKKLSVDKMLASPAASNPAQIPQQLSYRTKKVTIYKPHLPTTKPVQISTTSTNNIAPPSRRKHGRETSKDDLDITLHLSMKRKRMEPRVATANRLSITKRDSTLNSYQMQYDLGSVTDIEDDSEDEYDNLTVVHHDSSANESDDSFWDTQYVSNRSKNSSMGHRRKATYHAYGGDDDIANRTDSESGIGAEYDEEDLSDDSLNDMTRIVFNEDDAMSHDTQQDDDDDETDIETAHLDHLHESTETTMHSNEDIKPPIIKQISIASDDTCSINGSESSAVSTVDKSSISMQQMDKAAFLQKILRNSINKHKILKDEEMKKQKELKLQETHKTRNIKVIDENTIAINIGRSKMCDNAPIPEGDEEEHYGNHSQESDDIDTDTDPETAMLDFRHNEIHNMNNERMSDETSDDSHENMQHVRMFKVISDEASVFQDIALKDEIFSVQLKYGQEVECEYTNNANVVLLNKTKLYLPITYVMEVRQNDVNDMQHAIVDTTMSIKEDQDMDQFMKQENEELNELKEMLRKINAPKVEKKDESNVEKNDASNVEKNDASEKEISSTSDKQLHDSPQSETSMESSSSPSDTKIVLQPISKNMEPPPILIESQITQTPPKRNKRAKLKKKALSEKRVTIQKGKRKKRKKKKKKIISATPPSDTISPQFFYKEKPEKVRPLTEIHPDRPGTLKRSEIPRPESPIIAKYGERLMEHKEEILKMIEDHKRKKKVTKQQYTQSMTDDIKVIKTRSARAQTDVILTKYKAKDKSRKRKKLKGRRKRKDIAWMRADTEPKINAVTSWDEDDNNTKSRISLKERMQMYQENASPKMAQKKVKDIKAARKRGDSNASMSEEQKQKASHLLQEYAMKKAKHIADVTLIAQTLKDVTRQNSVEKLQMLGIISYIYVDMNEFERWNNRNNIANMIDAGDVNKEAHDEDPTQYIRMAVITLLNSKILIKLAEDQKETFKRLILFALEECQFIYKINFNAANITNAFLDKILKIIASRNVIIMQQNERHNAKREEMQNEQCFEALLEDKNMIYGPEILLIENNPISDRGIQMICNHVVKNDGLHLKCLKVGHCFGTISTNLCGSFCDSLQHNEHILKVTFDMRWLQHRSSVDKSLKQNYSRYRALQKKYKKIIKATRA